MINKKFIHGIEIQNKEFSRIILKSPNKYYFCTCVCISFSNQFNLIF